MVDGGRALTSSGYVKWEGHELMDRRFEPRSKNLFSYYAKKMTELFFTPSTVSKGTHEWLQEKQTSNWATHMEEAHFKITQGYARLDPENDMLKKMANEEHEPKLKQGDYMEEVEQDRVSRIFGYK